MNKNGSPKPLANYDASVNRQTKTVASSVIASAKQEISPPVKHFIGAPPLIGTADRKKIGVRAIVAQPGLFTRQRSLSPIQKNDSYDSKCVYKKKNKGSNLFIFKVVKIRQKVLF